MWPSVPNSGLCTLAHGWAPGRHPCDRAQEPHWRFRGVLLRVSAEGGGSHAGISAFLSPNSTECLERLILFLNAESQVGKLMQNFGQVLLTSPLLQKAHPSEDMSCFNSDSSLTPAAAGAEEHFMFPWDQSSMSSSGIASSKRVLGLRTISMKYVFFEKVCHSAFPSAKKNIPCRFIASLEISRSFSCSFFPFCNWK